MRLTANALELSLEQAWERADGVWFPQRGHPRADAVDARRVMPRIAEIITLIGSHNMLTTPSRADPHDSALRSLIDEVLYVGEAPPECGTDQVPRHAEDGGPFVGGRAVRSGE